MGPASATGRPGTRRFTRLERLRKRADFQRVFERGRRVHGRFMTLLVLPNNLEFSRLGIVASRKLGGAVDRNRAKRRIREIFRKNRGVVGLDVVVIPRPALLEVAVASAESDYRAALRRHERQPR